jgi:hypothetical protein
VSDFSALLPLLQRLGQNQTNFSMQMGHKYNPAAEWMPDMTPVLLGKKKPETDPNKPTLLATNEPIGQSGLFSGKGGGRGVS